MKRSIVRIENIENKNFKNVKYGIEFLGAYIKPYRMYISNKTLYRMYKRDFPKDKVELINSIVSRFGLLKRYSSYNIR